MDKDLAGIGSPHFATEEPRVDSLEKVTGRARYVEDLPDLPGTVYAAALRSPYSHARILSVDSSRAERLPGVMGVLHRGNLDSFGLNLHKKKGDQNFITTDKARFDGDLLGMVAAADLRTAQRAVELVEVEYEVLPVVFSVEEALSSGAQLVHEELGTNLALEHRFEWGDVGRGMREADRIFEETYTSQTVFHHPMEPSTSFAAHFVQDTVDLWFPTNTPFDAAPEVSKLFGIGEENVRVRVPHVGGSFGAKVLTPEVMPVLALSRKLGRPVKFIASGEESFRLTARHAVVYRAKIGVKSDGILVALDVDMEADTGAYFTAAAIITSLLQNSAWGCYRIPHFQTRTRTVYTNKVPAAHFRGSGKTQTTFGIECVLDSVARQMGIDPIEMRRKNVLRREEPIAEKWKWQGEESRSDTLPMDTDFMELMEKAVKAIGWDGRASARAAGAPVKPRRVRGKGMALSLRYGYPKGGRAYATATLDRSGIVKISHNAPDLGMGTHTVISVVAARTLNIPRSQVRVGTPDTINELPFDGVIASRTTVQMGNAVRAACEDLKQKLVAAAVRAKGGSPEEWILADGYLWRGEARFSFAEIVKAFEYAFSAVSFKGMGSYTYTLSADRVFLGGVEHWAPGAAAAEVEVDLETGEVRVIQFAAVADAGKAVHYQSAKRQIEGGAVMGFGIALFEEMLYQDGQLLNADAFQYRLPLMRDMPQAYYSLMVENGDGPGPFGAKAMSQTSIPCVAPAIGNAIRDAIGVHIHSTPFTAEKVLRALGKLS